MNIAEILKNCPEGMKLYSPIYGEMEFVKIMMSTGNIHCRTSKGDPHYFYPDGKYEREGECILFPSKEQRDWNQFLIPFKNGDVIITTDMTDIYPYENIAIFKEYREKGPRNKMIIHCQFDANGDFLPEEMDVLHKNWRLANQKEKDNFFKKMSEAGYCWTGKELVEQFTFGNIVAMYNPQYKHTHIAIFDKYIGDRFMKVVCTNLANSNKIKVFNEDESWNKQYVRHATGDEKEFFFNLLKEQGYVWDGKELKKKFSLCSLKPYDRVLVKTNTGCWYPTLVSYVEGSEVYLIDTTDRADYVIPFEGNEHLIGKWDDPDPYYITWK